jgi:hypothetical protein
MRETETELHSISEAPGPHVLGMDAVTPPWLGST